jgi:hypothetical protein
MKTTAVSCLFAGAFLVLATGCASSSHRANAQYLDAFGHPVVVTDFLSIQTKEGSIQFAFPKGWHVYSQPAASEPRGYVFNHGAGGLDLAPPLLSVVVRNDPTSRSTASANDIIEQRLRHELKEDHPDAGWQQIGEVATPANRRMPIYLAIGFPSGGRLTTIIPEDGFITQINLDCAQSGFDRMMSYQDSLEEIASSYRVLSNSSNQAMQPTAGRRTARFP